jgi:hypothetical protein
MGLLLAAASILPAAAAEPCADCGEPGYTEASAFLGAQGVDMAQHTVLFTWTERVDGMEVTGYHLQPLAADARFDIYSLGGRVLSEDEVKKLGIAKKDWSPRSVNVQAQPGSPDKKAIVDRPTPLAFPPAASIALPTPDVAKAMAEDEAGASTPSKGVLRTGVFVDVPAAVGISGKSASHGQWQALPSGELAWSVALNSAGARGLRVELTALQLPIGGGLIVYNAENPEEAFGPFTEIPAGEGVLWLPTCFGETVILECTVPATASLDNVQLQVGRVAHLYRDLAAAQWKGIGGACNLDFACYPAWYTTGIGVGGIGTVGATGTLWCTGTLIADLDPCTDVPYFLTANHCVSDQFDANAMEVYWLYQRDACNGVAPSPATVPRTIGGADRLAGAGGRGDTGGGNDFCFLRLRNSPPPGITYVGWNSNAAAAPLGTQFTCAHHPRGDYKRISFGTATDVDNNFPNLYHEVTWDQGTTEPGSSGSPLMLTATQQIVGQLWGGGASCSALTDPDYYGRFDVTYPVIEQYLNPLAEIGFEESEYRFSEDDGTVTIRVTTSAPAGALGIQVDYAITAVTAQEGSDYTATSNGTLSIAQGETEAEFTISLVQDTAFEEDETISLALSSPQCGQLKNGYDDILLIIEDDDVDSDGDGISDYDEINGALGYVTDPFNADTDGDGLTDLEEINGDFGYQTDPTLKDTDGDEVPDYFEIILGGDPTNPADSEGLSSMAVPWFE